MHVFIAAGRMLLLIDIASRNLKKYFIVVFPVQPVPQVAGPVTMLEVPSQVQIPPGSEGPGLLFRKFYLEQGPPSMSSRTSW